MNITSVRARYWVEEAGYGSNNPKSRYIQQPGHWTVYPIREDGTHDSGHVLSVEVIEGAPPTEEVILRHFEPILLGLGAEEVRNLPKVFYWDDQAQAVVPEKLERCLAVRSIEFQPGQSYVYFGGSPYDDRPSRLVVELEGGRKIDVLKHIIISLEVDRLHKSRRERFIANLPSRISIQTSSYHDKFNGWWRITHDSLEEWKRAATSRRRR